MEKNLDLDIADNHYEFSDVVGEAEVIRMPIMDNYPNPENQFDVFLHQDGEKSGVDPNAVAGAVGAVAGLVTTISQNRDESKKALKARCGGKPLFGKDKKKRYEECRERFFAEQQSYGGYSVNKSVPLNQAAYYPPMEEDRGLSTGAIVGIVLGVAAFAGLGFYLYKKNKG